RNPQYDPRALVEALAGAGISYLGLPNLGGRRQLRPEAPQSAWRNSSFLSYAHYMDTEAL
ncbi:MAG TPA: DUF488 family protein, partial [Gammaproteobacteria bacterium]|nr:DUF488 family protein [Gammaproteobacteria bacterium]